MRNQLKDVMAREQTFINSNTPDKTQAVTEHLRRIELSILSRTSEVLRGMFEHLTQRRARMNDQIQATHLF